MSHFIMKNVSADQLPKYLTPALPTQGTYNIGYGLDQDDGYFLNFTPVTRATAAYLIKQFKVNMVDQGFLDYSNYQFIGTKKRRVDRAFIVEVLRAIDAPVEHVTSIVMDLDLIPADQYHSEPVEVEPDEDPDWLKRANFDCHVDPRDPYTSDGDPEDCSDFDPDQDM